MTSDDDYYLDEECSDEDVRLYCAHEEYDADWEGRAMCLYCGHTWWQTQEEIERDERHQAEYAEWCAKHERRERIARLIDKLAFWRRWRKPAMTGDEIPF